jgi:1,4-dihydroxy-2-naphthoyl-CoA synthase
MSTSQEVKVSHLIVKDQADGVVLLQLNRPEVRNALNMALREELATAFLSLNRRRDVRCVVLTGDEKAFCPVRICESTGMRRPSKCCNGTWTSSGPPLPSVPCQ